MLHFHNAQRRNVFFCLMVFVSYRSSSLFHFAPSLNAKAAFIEITPFDFVSNKFIDDVYEFINLIFISFFLFLLPNPNRTKWKRQTSVGLELFVEAGNYAAYQRACASRFGQLDGLPYGNPLLMSGAHGMLPPPPPGSSAASAGMPNSVASAAELYYQQALQNSMNGLSPYSLYGSQAGASLPRPVPMVHPNFMPLNPMTSFYNNSPVTSPVANNKASDSRSDSLSSPSSAKYPAQHRSPTPVQLPKSTRHEASEDEGSDIEV